MKTSLNQELSGESHEDEYVLWGETQITDVIHEANQQQCEPESFIKARIAGQENQAPKAEFRTIYQKRQQLSLTERLLARWWSWRK